MAKICCRMFLTKTSGFGMGLHFRCSEFSRGRSSYPHWFPEETYADTSHSGLGDGQRFWSNSYSYLCEYQSFLLLVNKCLQAWSSVLNKVLLEYSIVTSKRHLSFESLTGEWGHHNLEEGESQTVFLIYKMLPCCPSPAHFSATQSRNISYEHWTPSLGRRADLSAWRIKIRDQ